ncbi:MAG: MauE/DoxX family redox-associated membrane protein [Micromonosporaceae bacterium]
MIQWIASLQPVLIAAVLGWAGVIKLRGSTQARQTAVARLVGEGRASATLRLVGAVELGVAAALLLPLGHVAAPGASALLSVGFLGYLGYARVVAPDSSCGCMSSRSERITWRAFARAGFLLVASLISVAGFAGWLGGESAGWWLSAAAGAPVAAVMVLVGEALLFGALSPEFDRHWLRPLRQLKVRLTHPLANLPHQVPLASTVTQLELSDAYRRVGTLITSDVQDSWDEGDWRIVCYRARVAEGRAATAVFAVPLHAEDPAAVRATLVDENVDESQGEPVPAHA